MTRTTILCAAILAVGGSLFAAPIPGLFNTGVDASGAPLGGSAFGGTADPHWRFGTGSAFTGPISGFYIQEPPGSVSRWISDNGQEGGHPNNYALTLQFDLTGLDASTASITGQFAVDDCGSIKLNGVTGGTIGNCDSLSSFGQYTPFSFTSGFLSGVNTISLLISNTPNTLSAGRVEFLSSSVREATGGPGPETGGQVPEPATWLLAGLGLGGLALRRRLS